MLGDLFDCVSSSYHACDPGFKSPPGHQITFELYFLSYISNFYLRLYVGYEAFAIPHPSTTIFTQLIIAFQYFNIIVTLSSVEV